MADELEPKLAHIREAFALRRYRYTLHAAQQSIARAVSASDIEESVASAEIIEDYPFHRFGPCCLLSGRTASDKPLHVVCSLRATVDIVTVYEPDPNEWQSDFKTRRA